MVQRGVEFSRDASRRGLEITVKQAMTQCGKPIIFVECTRAKMINYSVLGGFFKDKNS